MDLETFAFDYDQTFALLLLAPDGAVLHRYGSRDAASPGSALSEASLLRLLREGLTTWAAHRERGAKPVERPRRTLDDSPAWQRKVAERERKQQPIGCYHCHFVYDAELVDARDRGAWRPESVWRWPEPQRIGLTLDRDEQARVVAVRPGSPAAAAGLRPGDRLATLDGRRLLTWNDLSFALERARGRPASLPLGLAREGAAVETRLELPQGFEAATFRELAWRPSKWMLRPTPGFGGRDLRADERSALGLPAAGLAFRVSYFVDWSDEAPYARAARAAGVRKDDVVVSAGDAALASHDEFHAWWRLTHEAGDHVTVVVLRGGARHALTLQVP